MHCVCCFRWCRHVISWTADVWSELVSLISCILPPLPRFRAVTCDRPLCLQTRHMWRCLTFVKPRMQSRCSLVHQTFWPIRTGRTSATEVAWNMQMSTNDNSINARFCWQTHIRSRRDFYTFCYTDGLFKNKSMLVNLFFRDFWFSFPRESLFPRRIPGSEWYSHWLKLSFDTTAWNAWSSFWQKLKEQAIQAPMSVEFWTELWSLF